LVRLSVRAHAFHVDSALSLRSASHDTTCGFSLISRPQNDRCPRQSRRRHFWPEGRRRGALSYPRRAGCGHLRPLGRVFMRTFECRLRPVNEPLRVDVVRRVVELAAGDSDRLQSFYSDCQMCSQFVLRRLFELVMQLKRHAEDRS
jgi:hypothetical protein